MDKFSSALRGYDKSEVNAFIDKIIEQVESMVKEIEEKDAKIANLQKLVKKSRLNEKKLTLRVKELKEQVESLGNHADLAQEYESTIATLNRAKIETKKIMADARARSKKIVDEAKDNADTIVKECLLSAKKREMELNTLKNEIDKLKQTKETLY